MKDNELLSLYGCRKSKNGNGWNITLVSGQGDERKFYYCYVKADRVDEYADHIELSVKTLETKGKAVTIDEIPF